MQNRVHFLGLAARSLRHILVDHARAHSARKRGNGLKVDLTSVDAAIRAPDHDLLSLDDALTRLEILDERAARVVELRFFGGLSEAEVAPTIGVLSSLAERLNDGRLPDGHVVANPESEIRKACEVGGDGFEWRLCPQRLLRCGNRPAAQSATGPDSGQNASGADERRNCVSGSYFDFR